MNAQLLSQKKVFTRMDSLRGSLREERNCFDVTFYNLSIDFDTLNKTISGRNAIYFNATSRSNKIQIDLAENLSIDQISYRNRPLTFTREFNAVFVSLPEPLVNTTKARTSQPQDYRKKRNHLSIIGTAYKSRTQLFRKLDHPCCQRYHYSPRLQSKEGLQ